MSRPETIYVRKLGRQSYEPVWRAMQQYTDIRDGNSPDDVLVDLRRLGIGIRDLVTAIETSIVAVLAKLGIAAHPRADAPGVYLDSGAKIAQLGLRVRRGSTFHGLSLNIDMDLSVFLRINPCGHQGMEVSDIRRQRDIAPPSQPELIQALSAELAGRLGYTNCREASEHTLPKLPE